jgi:hypothetical protein
MIKRVRLEQIVSFFVGAAVGIVLNRVTGWWLDSGTGVAAMVAAEFAAAFFVARWRVPERKERAISLWLGALSGMSVYLVWTGPGTIWPLVLSVAALVTAAPVLAGVVVASIMEWAP